MVQFLSIIFFWGGGDFFNFCWVFQKFPFFCVTCTICMFMPLSRWLLLPVPTAHRDRHQHHRIPNLPTPIHQAHARTSGILNKIFLRDCFPYSFIFIQSTQYLTYCFLFITSLAPLSTRRAQMRWPNSLGKSRRRTEAGFSLFSRTISSMDLLP